MLEFDCIRDCKRVVVALSGGSDSLALLVLLKKAAQKAAQFPKIYAVTVDHGLRSESGSEAKRVGQICSTLGIEHDIVRWDGDKPTHSVMENARYARYDLLAKWAIKHDIQYVVTGHTKNDQRETIAMRQERGARLGLSGIAPASLWHGNCAKQGVWFVRPLLSHTREELRDYLREFGVEWIDDPSNLNTRYERVKWRFHLDRVSDIELRKLDAIGYKTQKRRMALSQRISEMIDEKVVFLPIGLVGIPTSLAFGDDDAADLFRVLIAFCGGLTFMPRFENIAHVLYCLEAKPCLKMTLGRVLMTKRRDYIWLMRENRNIGPWKNAIFDNRFTHCGHVEDIGEEIRFTSNKNFKIGDCIPLDERSRPTPAMQALAHKTYPPLQQGPLSTKMPVVPLLNPWARVVPSFDFASAKALANLTGAAWFHDEFNALPILRCNDY